MPDGPVSDAMLGTPLTLIFHSSIPGLTGFNGSYGLVDASGRPFSAAFVSSAAPNFHVAWPVHMIESINKLNRISREIFQQTGKEAHPAMLAERMEISEEKVRGMLKVGKQPGSLETPVGEDADATLGDMIEDQTAVSPAEAAIHANMRAAIDEALAALLPREAKVFQMRFGIDTASDCTFDELGKQFDVTRERFRQIEGKAMRKLMHPSRADKLREFLER